MNPHLAVDAGAGGIIGHVLAEGTVDDAAQVPALLGQAEGTIVSVTADGAYDGAPTYAAVRARQSNPPPVVVTPHARRRCRAQVTPRSRPCATATSG